MKLEGLNEFEEKMFDLLKKMPNKKNRFVAQQAELLLGLIKKETPVGKYDDGKTGGTLRDGWHRTRANQGVVEVYNNTDYAAHVEYGHRTRGGKKFVRGAKMMHRGLLAYKKSFDSQAGDIMRRILEEDL